MKEAEDKEGKKKKKSGGLFKGMAAMIAVALMFLFGKGFGLGNGLGFGFDNDKETGESQVSRSDEASVESAPESSTESSEVTEVTVTIVVKQKQILIDGEEKTLSDIEDLLKQEGGTTQTTYVLEDNYATNALWNDLKALFDSYGISVVE